MTNALIECGTPRCGAKFDPTVQWVYGTRDPDVTYDDFRARGRIPLGNCPVCRKPQSVGVDSVLL